MKTPDRVHTKLLDGSLDVLHAALLTHVLGGEVAVQTSTVPVTRLKWISSVRELFLRLRDKDTHNWLGLDRDLGAELLGNTVEQEPSEPEVVTHLNALAGADLELPLGGHDFGVGSGDLDTGVKAAPVVCLDDVTLDNLLQRTSVNCS